MSTYADRIYASYSEVRPHHAVPSRPADLLLGREPVFRKLFAPLLPSSKDAKILDLGCGYGEFIYFLQLNGYTKAMGIDLNEKQLEVGERLGVTNLQRRESGQFLRESAGIFDFISAIDILEHIPKTQVLELLDLVFAALRPSGRFLCQVPNLAAFHTPLFYMDFSHETPFTASSLKQVLELANFANVRVSPMGPVVHGAKSAVRSILWTAIGLSLRLIQTVEAGPGDRLRSIFTSAVFAIGDKA